MDLAASAGTSAIWLDAFVRTQTKPDVPEQPGPAKTLTDVIERALRSGGLDSKDPDWVDPTKSVQLNPTRPGQVVNLVV